MDSIDYAQKLVVEFGVDQTDALKSLDAEVDDERNDPFQRKPAYEKALVVAYERIREWLQRGADEYAIDLTWESVRNFAHSHRKACVWAVLTSKAMADKKAQS